MMILIVAKEKQMEKILMIRTQEYYTKFYLQDYVLTKMDRAKYASFI